jgi:phosphoribosylformylglycinamidine (FGAM) synthase PurS component
MIRAQVIVRPRASIFDPQGDAVCRAIQSLGVAVKQAQTICHDLLSNPVIEDYVLTVDGETSVGKK